MNKSKIWSSVFGWFNTGEYVIENLSILAKGMQKEQTEALQNIILEIEHQGGLSYLAPFAVQELILTLKKEEPLVQSDIIAFFDELDEVINLYLELFDSDTLKRAENKSYDLNSLITFINQYPDEEGENSIWGTPSIEGLMMVHLITRDLIQNYKKTNIL